MIFALLLAAAQPAPPRIIIHISTDSDGTCRFRWNEESISQDGLLVRARAQSSESAVHIVGDATTTYKCVGGVIYELQLAGIAKIGFIAQPPSSGERDK